MSSIPPWSGATAGLQSTAGQVNQFLAAHPTTALWSATLQANNITNGATTVGSNGLYIAQSFLTSANQSAIGYVLNPIGTTTTSGAGLAPTTLSLYANNQGAPDVASGPLVSATITAEYAYSNSGAFTTNTSAYYPLPYTGLAANSTYWLVLAATASSGQYTWFQSSATSGASTSPDGVTWTPQAYGLRYRIFDQSTTAPLLGTWEDGGARWTTYIYNTNGTLARYNEFTDCQGTSVGSYVQSCRTYNYSQNMLTSIS